MKSQKLWRTHATVIVLTVYIITSTIILPNMINPHASGQNNSVGNKTSQMTNFTMDNRTADKKNATIIDDPSTRLIPHPQDFIDKDKSIVVLLKFFTNPDNIIIESAKVVRGRAHTHYGDPNILAINLRDFKDRSIEGKGFMTWNPLMAFTYDENSVGSLITLPNVTGRFVFPFDPNLGSMQLVDIDSGEQLATIDLKPVIHKFCEENSLTDPDCKRSDLVISNANLSNMPQQINQGDSANILLGINAINEGTDAPTEVLLSSALAFPSELRVTPLGTIRSEDTLALNEQRQRNLNYDVTCLEAGIHDIEFKGFIVPLAPTVIDPDGENNDYMLKISVNCVAQ